MTVRVEIQPEAETQLKELDAWWRVNRPAAASHVIDEFARVIELLSEIPDVGPQYHGHAESVRWIRLKNTPYIVFYHHVAGTDLLTVLSIWSGARKKGPRIK